MQPYILTYYNLYAKCALTSVTDSLFSENFDWIIIKKHILKAPYNIASFVVHVLSWILLCEVKTRIELCCSIITYIFKQNPISRTLYRYKYVQFLWYQCSLNTMHMPKQETKLNDSKMTSNELVPSVKFTQGWYTIWDLICYQEYTLLVIGIRNQTIHFPLMSLISVVK